MKSKELIGILVEAKKNNTLKKDLPKVLSLFIDETQKTILYRNCKSNDAIRSVFLEFDDRWKSICRKAGLSVYDGYKRVCAVKWDIHAPFFNKMSRIPNNVYDNLRKNFYIF